MRAWILIAASALAACGADEPSEAEQARDTARSIAMVEKANNVMPPLEEVTPETIAAPDIERYDLGGASCNYAPGTSLGTRVVARETDAYVKIDGEMLRFSADAGSRELPLKTRALYSGRGHALRLAIVGGDESVQAAPGEYEGTVTLLDEHGREVYEGAGVVQCAD